MAKKNGSDRVSLSVRDPETGEHKTVFDGTGAEFDETVRKFETIADQHGIPRHHAHAAAGKGHNTRVGGVAVDQLRSIIERVEKLSEEKAGIQADISEVFAEAKGNGFDLKALRKIILLRRKDAAEADEEEAIFDTYRRALGMLPQLDLPFERE